MSTATIKQEVKEEASPDAPTSKGKKSKRLLAGLDLTVLEEGGGRSAKRRAVEDGDKPRSRSVQHTAVQRSPEQVQADGLVLWRAIKDAKEGDRILSADFEELPPAEEYPDYYEVIKKPMSMNEVKNKLNKLLYTSLDGVRGDLNQIFVNAMRYNAAGYPIHEDAKYLRKLVASRFAIITGQAEVDDDRLQKLRRDKLPTLKSWLQQKLDLLWTFADDNGRQYSEIFRELPDPDQLPDYYRTIPQPMSLMNIQRKLDKRVYTQASQFAFDLKLIVENAKYYNEERSQIWKDAKMMEKYIADLMSEPVPDFAALAAEAERKEREGFKLKLSLGGAGGATISAAPPEPAHVPRIKLKLPKAASIDPGTPLLTPRDDSPYLGTPGAYPTPSPSLPPVALKHEPALPPAPPRIHRDRIIAPLGGDPLITALIIRSKPSATVQELSTTGIRQHAVVLPRSTDTMEITPVTAGAMLRAVARPYMTVTTSTDTTGRMFFTVKPPISATLSTIEVFAKAGDGVGEEVYRLFLQRLPM